MYIDSFESNYHYNKAIGYRRMKWPELYIDDFTKTKCFMVDFGALDFSKEEYAQCALIVPSLHIVRTVPTIPNTAHRTVTLA